MTTDAFEHEHDEELVEAHRKSLLSIDSITIEAVRCSCPVEDCNFAVNRLESVGDLVETIDDYNDIAYELYESFYDNPRSVSYWVLGALFENPDGEQTPTRVVDIVARAVDTGVLHAKNDHPKLLRGEFLDEHGLNA